MRKKRLLSIIVAASMFMSSVPFSAYAGETEIETETEMAGDRDWIWDFVSALSDSAVGFAGEMGDAAGEAARKTEEAFSEAARKTGDAFSDAVQKAGEELEELVATNQISLEELGNLTAEQASEWLDSLGDALDQTSEALEAASDFVVDQTGEVVDVAVDAKENASEAAQTSMSVIKEKGKELVQIVTDAISDIDLTDPEAIKSGKEIAKKAIQQANESGLFGVSLDEDTIDTVTAIVYSATVYGLQYSQNLITLAELVSCISAEIIKEGLPCGVGFLAEYLPIPGAESLAEAATIYLIAKAEKFLTSLANEPSTETEG